MFGSDHWGNMVVLLVIVYGYTDKKKYNFPYILGNSEGSSAKSDRTNNLLIYGENICAFPHILGSPSS
jgi:hypothetical protein